MGDDRLRQLVRDLIAMRVGMEVRAGQPTLTVPDAAEAMVRSNLEAIRAARDDIVRLWAEVAAERRVDVWVCKECEALVLDPAEAATSRWAFCESLYCPYRKDGPAVRFRRSDYETRRLAEQRRAKALADDPASAEPIPN